MAEAQTEKTTGARVYDPRVLVFACNWCSYAGADTAGVSRLPQSPHFRLLRVMCSGRVHPAFVLRAFARGADGVMVSGCHFGDCHYRFGNYRAVEQYEKLEAIVGLLGLEPDRLRLEWISAAEGIRFATIMNEFVEQVRAVGPSPLAPERGDPAEARGADPLAMTSTRVFSCLECGRCTAVCPVAPYQTFSPRRLVSRLIAAGLEALAAEPSLWTCLTCERCSSVCPAGVDYTRFVIEARAAAVAADLAPAAAAEERAAGAATPHGETGETAPSSGRERAIDPPRAEVIPCSHGGVFEQISVMHTREPLRQKRLGWLTPDLRVTVLEEGERTESENLLFVGCSPYFSAYFGGDTGRGLHRTMRSVVRLLNQTDVGPAVLANERCCGHHLRVSGRAAEADRLAELVGRQIATSGVKRVVAFCPECLVSLGQIVSAHAPGVEVVHLSEFLTSRAEAFSGQAFSGQAFSGGAPSDAASPEKITYQDPCRLGRGSGLFDTPRKLLTEIAGADLSEMNHHSAQAVCCGNTAWLNCNAGTKRFQTARLEEAGRTGSRKLITACPGCYIHLRCAQEGAEEAADPQVEIVDLWNFLAESVLAEDKPESEE